MLEISPFEKTDIETFYRYQCDQEICYLSGVDSDDSFDEFMARYEGLLNLDFNEFPLKVYSLKFDGKVIGRLDCRLENDEMEFGITIGEKSYRGKGFSKLFLGEFFRYCFDGLKVKSIFAEVLTHNKRSINLMKRMNGELEETIKNGEKINDMYYDVNIYRFKRESLMKKPEVYGIIVKWIK